MTSGGPVVRVAVAQLAPRIGDVRGNRELSGAAIRDAAEAGAEVVVLPELASSGYVFESRDEALLLAESRVGPTISGWADAARRHGIAVIGGFCELGDDHALYNSAALVDRDGLRAVYRKVHLWEREKSVFEPGSDAPPIVRTGACAVGVGICYDLEFPEFTRGLALGGADLLAFPTNSPDLGGRSEPHPMEVVVSMATAHVNRVFVAVADRCGRERGVDWVGATVIVGPDGWPAAGPPPERVPTIAVADCDLAQARDKSWGPANDLFADRRPSLYAAFQAADLGDVRAER